MHYYTPIRTLTIDSPGVRDECLSSLCAAGELGAIELLDELVDDDSADDLAWCIIMSSSRWWFAE